MRFSKAEPYESQGRSYQLWVVQTINGYSAEAINDSQQSLSTPTVAYPSANEALDAARAVADADAQRVLQVRWHSQGLKGVGFLVQHDLAKIGEKAPQAQVKEDHFPDTFNLGL